MYDWILRCGEFQSVDLRVDYGCPLMGQVDFVRFNGLLREIGVYNFADDDEAVRLAVALMNSLFWDYDSSRHRLANGELTAELIDDLCDRMIVEHLVLRHLTKIADHYKHCHEAFSGEKVILEQSLAAMADVAQRSGIGRRYTLVAHLLMLELHEFVSDISVFESKVAHEADSLSTREASVRRALGYLGREHHGRCIISSEEYATLVNEVMEILTTGRVATTIVPLKLMPNGALRSGFSTGFVSYGIYRLYGRCKVARSVWIEYLLGKIGSSKSNLQKKFTRRPSSWSEKIVGD